MVMQKKDVEEKAWNVALAILASKGSIWWAARAEEINALV